MKVFIQISDGSNWDVTEIVGEISWRYELETLAGELSMNINSNQFGVGDKILLKHNNYEIFRGMIVSESGKNNKNITAMDFGWNLNKNELSIQFKGVSVKQSILTICNKFGIGVELPDLNTKVTKIYKDEPASDIIKDLLQISKNETGTGYYMRVFGNVLAIRSYRGKDPIEVYNIEANYSLDKTIENLYNRVLIITDSEKSIQTLAKEEDPESIKRYGLLQMIETISEEDKSKSKNVAKNKLKEINKIEENFSISCDGDFQIVAGRLVKIQDKEIKGTYLVKEVTHNFKSQHNHRCSLVLEVFN